MDIDMHLLPGGACSSAQTTLWWRIFSRYPVWTSFFIASFHSLKFYHWSPERRGQCLLFHSSLWGNHRLWRGLCSWLMPLLPPHTPMGLTLTQLSVRWWSEVTLYNVQSILQSSGFTDNNPFNITSLWKFSRINYVRNENVTNYWKCRVKETSSEPGPNSVKYHFTEQIFLMLPGHKLTGKRMVQCSLPRMEFSMFQQCAIHIDVE